MLLMYGDFHTFSSLYVIKQILCFVLVLLCLFAHSSRSFEYFSALVVCVVNVLIFTRALSFNRVLLAPAGKGFV